MAKKTSGVSLSDLVNQYSAEKEDTFIPTGISTIDDMIGGGICPGGMYGMWGPQGSGKSTVAAQIIKSYCKRGDRCMWIDVEKALNKNQQEAFGLRSYVEDGTLIHVAASTYVEADELTMAVANDNEMNVKMVVVDSESMLMAKIADDQRVDDNQPGQKARQCSVWLTKVKDAFFRKGISIIVLFHARANISMTANPYAPASKQAGGYAALHIPDCILQVQPGQKFGDKECPTGQIVHLTTDKNKFAPPFKKVDFKLFFGVGIKKSVELIDKALECGVITQSGSFFKLPNGETIRGTDNLYSLPSETLKEIKKHMS